MRTAEHIQKDIQHHRKQIDRIESASDIETKYRLDLINALESELAAATAGAKPFKVGDRVVAVGTVVDTHNSRVEIAFDTETETDTKMFETTALQPLDNFLTTPPVSGAVEPSGWVIELSNGRLSSMRFDSEQECKKSWPNDTPVPLYLHPKGSPTIKQSLTVEGGLASDEQPVGYFNIVAALCRAAAPYSNVAIKNHMERLVKALEESGDENKAEAIRKILTAPRDSEPASVELQDEQPVGYANVTKHDRFTIPCSTEQEARDCAIPTDMEIAVPLYRHPAPTPATQPTPATTDPVADLVKQYAASGKTEPHTANYCHGGVCCTVTVSGPNHIVDANKEGAPVDAEPVAVAGAGVVDEIREAVRNYVNAARAEAHPDLLQERWTAFNAVLAKITTLPEPSDNQKNLAHRYILREIRPEHWMRIAAALIIATGCEAGQ